MSKGSVWREDVFTRDMNGCMAFYHAKGCVYRAEQAHHIVFRSHLTDDTMWLLENGESLSLACHAEAHRTHNGNIRPHRLVEAVAAVNAIILASNKPELAVQPFQVGLGRFGVGRRL